MARIGVSNPLRSWRARLLLAVLLLGAIILPLPTHGADCSAAPLPRLVAGGVARVSYLGSGTVKLYNFPGLNAREVSTVREGTPLNVQRGPICAEGRQWFQLRTLDNRGAGWAIESDERQGKASYVLEPWQILVDLFQPTGTDYRLIRVSQNGLMSQIATYAIPKLTETVGELWPPQELKPPTEALAAALHDCPNDAIQWNPDLNGIFFFGNLPVDTGQVTAYPAPDSARLIIVRHLWRSVVGCDQKATDLYGIDRVSLAVNSTETVLFDVPANGRIAGFTREDTAYNRVIDVRWSPDNVQAVAWVSYGEQTRLIRIDSSKGTIQLLDEGIYPVWREHGERLAWLRPDRSATIMNLIISRSDGTGRQTLAFPNTLQYTNARFAPLWNADGTRLLACVRQNACQTVMPLEIDTRKPFAPLTVPPDAKQPHWVLHDTAILWQPETGHTFTIQPLEGTARTLDLDLKAGETVAEVHVFPGGDAALVALRSKQARYVILNFGENLAPDSVVPVHKEND